MFWYFVSKVTNSDSQNAPSTYVYVLHYTKGEHLLQKVPKTQNCTHFQFCEVTRLNVHKHQGGVSDAISLATTVCILSSV